MKTVLIALVAAVALSAGTAGAEYVWRTPNGGAVTSPTPQPPAPKVPPRTGTPLQPNPNSIPGRCVRVCTSNTSCHVVCTN
jgi:hypothetical protein